MLQTFRGNQATSDRNGLPKFQKFKFVDSSGYDVEKEVDKGVYRGVVGELFDSQSTRKEVLFFAFENRGASDYFIVGLRRLKSKHVLAHNNSTSRDGIFFVITDNAKGKERRFDGKCLIPEYQMILRQIFEALIFFDTKDYSLMSYSPKDIFVDNGIVKFARLEEMTVCCREAYDLFYAILGDIDQDNAMANHFMDKVWGAQSIADYQTLFFHPLLLRAPDKLRLPGELMKVYPNNWNERTIQKKYSNVNKYHSCDGWRMRVIKEEFLGVLKYWEWHDNENDIRFRDKYYQFRFLRNCAEHLNQQRANMNMTKLTDQAIVDGIEDIFPNFYMEVYDFMEKNNLHHYLG